METKFSYTDFPLCSFIKIRYLYNNIDIVTKFLLGIYKWYMIVKTQTVKHLFPHTETDISESKPWISLSYSKTKDLVR